MRQRGLRPKLKVWIVVGGRVKFGDGRAQLLELVDELGAFRGAVARLGMSYRNAWGYFRELEAAAGCRLLERQRGGRGGMRLTPEGRRFLARYRAFRQGLDEVVERRFRRSFRAGPRA